MPTPTHHFIKLLENKGILRTNATQNIDNLESKTGISTEKLIQAHGANVGAACARCKEAKDRKQLDDAIDKGEVLYCKGMFTPKDSVWEEKIIEIAGQKIPISSSREVMGEPEPCKGPIKPNIVFFGEGLPEKFQTTR